MHDIKYIRENPDEFDAGLKKRGHRPMAKHILAVDGDRRIAIAESDVMLSERNDLSKQANQARTDGNQELFDDLCSRMALKKEAIAEFEKIAKLSDNALDLALLQYPNIPMHDVPIGKDENDNKELHRWGTIPSFNYPPKEHFDIPAVQPSMDFKIASELSGSRFVLLSGAIARVHRALAQFMLDLHINEHGLMEINTPVIVNSKALEGTGQLPKFAEDCYKIHSDNEGVENATDQWLIPTSEVPLTNMYANTIINRDRFPQRYCAHSLCFRQEAGSAGRDTAGMLRQHQFEKVEMVSITTPEKSREELDIMTTKAEAVLKKLNLAFRTVVLCTGDMGFSAQRTHDIEVWLPGQNRYREISSVSVCGDFQARRMNARFREKDGDKPQFVHTLNGSGVAVGRCLIAVLENGQQKDGSVKLPKALHPYLGGKDTINPDGILEKAT